MTITEFLEARIAEDEADAAPDPDWDDYKGHCDAAGVHHTPERARAECAAKRRFVEDYARYEMYYGPKLFYVLAAVYKDHPDYQQEWAL